MPSALAGSRSTRRTATVTISAPDASIARCIVSLSRYFPVPTRRREWTVRPAMVSGVSRTTSTVVVIRSPASHEMHQLDRVARGDLHLAERRAAHDRAVVLHHHGARVERQRLQQLEQGGAARHRPLLPVHRDVDGLARHCFRNPSSMLRAAVAGSAASHSALIAAAPYTPAAVSSGIRSAVTPPTAITGSPSCAISARRSRPSGDAWGCVAVANTGPTKR